MTAKPVVPRERANQDVDEAVSYYLSADAPDAALGFIEALEAAYRHIAQYPASGSPRYAHALNLQGIRVWPLRHYPYLVFHPERSDHIDIWRVLHAERDIPAWMHEPD